MYSKERSDIPISFNRPQESTIALVGKVAAACARAALYALTDRFDRPEDRQRDAANAGHEAGRMLTQFLFERRISEPNMTRKPLSIISILRRKVGKTVKLGSVDNPDGADAPPEESLVTLIAGSASQNVIAGDVESLIRLNAFVMGDVDFSCLPGDFKRAISTIIHLAKKEFECELSERQAAQIGSIIYEGLTGVFKNTQMQKALMAFRRELEVHKQGVHPNGKNLPINRIFENRLHTIGLDIEGMKTQLRGFDPMSTIAAYVGHQWIGSGESQVQTAKASTATTPSES